MVLRIRCLKAKSNQCQKEIPSDQNPPLKDSDQETQRTLWALCEINKRSFQERYQDTSFRDVLTRICSQITATLIYFMKGKPLWKIIFIYVTAVERPKLMPVTCVIRWT